MYMCVCVCAWMCGVQVCLSVYAVMVRVCAYRCVVRVSVHASHAEMFLLFHEKRQIRQCSMYRMKATTTTYLV